MLTVGHSSLVWLIWPPHLRKFCTGNARFAEAVLTCLIRSSIVYKYPHNYCQAEDTYSVESLNNVLNIWHDKRICFGAKQYEMRTNWAILHWNENVDRPHTSVWETTGPSPACKKNLVKCTYRYREKVWDAYADKLFQ